MCRVIAIALLLSPATARAAGPVCALLDPEKSPRVALLEAKLLADPAATWVERGGIDKVLKEQKLQAAFSPQGVGDRVALGKLLKADVLVLVRPVKDATQESLEVAVSETAGGLRLLVRAVPVTKDADADVAALLGAVRDGIKKHGETVKEVVAVPPFASGNLGYEFDHLKGAFAKLVEQAALARPGVVVVELAEAEAVARELTLAAPGATVARRPPLYLLGEYRHQGRGADVRVALKLRAERSGKPSGPPVEQTLAPGEVPPALRKWADEQLAAIGGAPPASADPKAEARLLSELARSRHRLGDWADALALIEASLLLDPAQPELNADAMAALRHLIAKTIDRDWDRPDRVRLAAQLHRRGLAHMEALYASGAKLPRYEGYGVRGSRVFESSFPLPRRFPTWAARPSPYPPAVREIMAEVDADRRAAFRSVLPRAVEMSSAQETALLVEGILLPLPAAEYFAELGRIVLKHQDSPGVVAALGQNHLIGPSPGVQAQGDFAEYRKMLDALEKDGNARVRESVANYRKTVANIEKGFAAQVARTEALRKADEERLKNPKAYVSPYGPRPVYPTTREGLDKLIDERQQTGPFRRINLKAESPDDDWFVDQLRGGAAAGPGVDVFWAQASIHRPKPGDDPDRLKVGKDGWGRGFGILVMKEKGVLRRVLVKASDEMPTFTGHFDGKYLWLVAEMFYTNPVLYVFDPASEKVFEVTAADGMPQPPAPPPKGARSGDRYPLRLGAVGPGRVVVTGWFGRAWVGIATFEGPTKRPAVKVIHEAREVTRPGDTEPWREAKLAFVPESVTVLRGKPGPNGTAPVRVLIDRGLPPLAHGRVSESFGVIGWHPLVVDPASGTVEVMKEELRVRGGMRTARPTGDGSVILVTSAPSKPFAYHLTRIEYPATIRDLGELAVPGSSTAIAVVGNRLYLAPWNPVKVEPGKQPYQSSSWWVADLDGKNPRKVASDTLKIVTIQPSSHYGVIAWCTLDLGHSTRVVCNEVLPDAAK